MIERFESESRNAEMADSIWNENELAIDETSAFKLINFLDTPHSFLRTATSKAITAAIQEYPELLSNFFDELVAVLRKSQSHLFLLKTNTAWKSILVLRAILGKFAAVLHLL